MLRAFEANNLGVILGGEGKDTSVSLLKATSVSFPASLLE